MDEKKDFLIYLIGSAVQAAASFLLLPLYLKYLSPHDFGVIAVLTTTQGILSLVNNLGVVSGIFRFYYEAGEREKKQMVGTVFTAYLFSSLLLVLPFLFFSTQVSNIFFKTPIWSGAVIFMGISHIVTMLSLLFFSTIRIERKAVHFVVISILQFLLMAIFNIYLIVYQNLGVLGYFQAMFYAYLFSVLVMIVMLRRKIEICFDWGLFKKLFSTGFAFIFSTITVWNIDNVDRYFINFYLGPTPLGIYHLSYKVVKLFEVIFITPMGYFAPPYIMSYFSAHSEDEARGMLMKMYKYFIISGCFFIMLINAVAPDILRLITDNAQYRQATLYSFYLIFTLLVYKISGPAFYFLFWKKELNKTIIINVIAFLINFGLNFWFIPQFKLYGAAASTMAAYIFFIIGYYYLARKYIPAAEFLFFCFASILLTGFAGYGFLAISFPSALLSLGVKSAIFAAIFAFYLFGTKTGREMKNLAQTMLLRKERGEI